MRMYSFFHFREISSGHPLQTRMCVHPQSQTVSVGCELSAPRKSGALGWGGSAGMGYTVAWGPNTEVGGGLHTGLGPWAQVAEAEH